MQPPYATRNAVAQSGANAGTLQCAVVEHGQ